MAKQVRRKRGWIVRTFAAVAGLYGLIASAFLLLRLVVDDRFLPMALYSTTAHLLWLAALVLFVLSLLLRTWRTALLLLLPAAAWLIWFGPRYVINRTELPRRSGETVTAATYNLLWRTSDYRESIALIRTIDADVIALQEVGFDAARRIETALSDLYPYMALDPQEWGINGQGVLSKYPIVERVAFEFDSNPRSFLQQRVIIEHPGASLLVYNVHLFHPLIGGLTFDIRRAETQELIERVRGDRGGVPILLGDFNMTELNDDYAAIRRYFTDAYRNAGYGMGLTHALRFGRFDLPRWMRLDYIFAGVGLEPLEARVHPVSGGSDHAPVWARLEFYDTSVSYPP